MRGAEHGPQRCVNPPCSEADLNSLAGRRGSTNQRLIQRELLALRFGRILEILTPIPAILGDQKGLGQDESLILKMRSPLKMCRNATDGRADLNVKAVRGDTSSQPGGQFGLVVECGGQGVGEFPLDRDGAVAFCGEKLAVSEEGEGAGELAI